VGDTPTSDVNWRRETKGEVQSLPHERKALAERYTIDADEADRRAQLAAEQAAAEEATRQAAAEESARRAAAADAARKEASAAVERELAEHARASVSPEPQQHTVSAPVDPGPPAEPSEPHVVAASAQEEQLEQTADLPIYRWFGNS
jgi:hypothetical protein